MFTGITRGTFPITEIEAKPDLATFVVELDGELTAGLERGASVLIDGVCQTVTDISGHRVSFDAIQETLARTTLADLEVGRKVAVERSVRVGDEIGGHDVAGHVNGTGSVAEVRQDGSVFDLRITVPGAWMSAILEKGFIAVDGSSLTVGEVVEADGHADGQADGQGSFWVHLIPETLRLTNLGSRRVGDRVNIELDARTVAIVRTVERVLEARQGPGGS
jgi:riboflavin synthase